MGVYRFLAPKTGEVLPEGFRDLDVFKASTRSLRSLTGEDLPPGAYWNVGWRTGDNLSGCSGEVSGEELTTGLYLKQKKCFIKYYRISLFYDELKYMTFCTVLSLFYWSKGDRKYQRKFFVSQKVAVFGSSILLFLIKWIVKKDLCI